MFESLLFTYPIDTNFQHYINSTYITCIGIRQYYLYIIFICLFNIFALQKVEIWQNENAYGLSVYFRIKNRTAKNNLSLCIIFGMIWNIPTKAKVLYYLLSLVTKVWHGSRNFLCFDKNAAKMHFFILSRTKASDIKCC